MRYRRRPLPAGRRRQARVGAFVIAMVLVLATSCLHNVTIDFDGDSRSDIAWYSVSSGSTSWVRIPPQDFSSIFTPTLTATNEEFLHVGAAVKPVPADYDGNGKPDVAYIDGTGNWVTGSGAGTIAFPAPPIAHAYATNYKVIPVPGRYTTAGRAVPAWYDDSAATWYIHGLAPIVFGAPPTAIHGVDLGSDIDFIDQDIPVPADYDGDRLDDLAVYSPLTGLWRIRYSHDQSERTLVLGGIHEAPAPADYDGDRRADVAVYTYLGTGSHSFTIEGQPGGQVWTGPSGQAISEQDIPVVADYDGDGKADFAAFDSTSDNEAGMAGILQIKASSNGNRVRLNYSTPFVGIPLAMPRPLLDNRARINLLYANYCLPQHPPTC